jgi:NADPH:quinone reductase-like Zn-dependent oxidoreductase
LHYQQTENSCMKAIVIHEFGGVEIMKTEDIAIPVPGPGEILLKLYASGVNHVDCVIRSGANESLRSILTLPVILGWDAAGIIEETGTGVTEFRKGDAVYGVPDFPGNGSYAEYCVAKASRFALKPESIGFNEAAAVPLAAITAWTGIFADGKLQAGQRILIQGASGGVGSFAVQFAKAKGAYVIGMASTENVEYLRQLGADEVIDYKTRQFEDLVHDVDLVLEASQVRDNKERIKSVSVLNEGGIFVSVNTDFAFNDDLTKAFASRGVTGVLSANQPRKDWLEQIARLIDDGKVRVLKTKVLPLGQVADAHHETERSRINGKLVLEVTEEKRGV